ncbi:MAG: SDR family NAD(P)-dependent oxidoreductase [Pseudomonadota bacterium]
MSDTAVVIGVGASAGLGAALCRRFGREGLHVFVAGRTKEKLDAIVEEVTSAGGSAEAAVCDVTSASDQDKLFDAVAAKGRCAAVLYNAGSNAIIPFEDLTDDQFETFWRVCTFGAFLTAKRAAPLLAGQAGGGSLLFTGASASLRGRANFAHFAAAKGALRNLAQSLAREYGPKGVHVGHVIVDGVIDGDMVRSRFAEYLDRLGEDGGLNPDAIAEAFWTLHAQHRSAWTHELDVRPYKENW